MSLLGNVTRVDCNVAPQSQGIEESRGLSVQLFELVCGNDGSAAATDNDRGRALAAQRVAETAIINENLMTAPASAPWTFRSFDEDSLVILDCPRAGGGICVINSWNANFIHITTFRLMGERLRDEIWMQPSYFLEHQGSSVPVEGEINVDVMGTMAVIRQGRYFFDHPEFGQTVRDSVMQGVRNFFGWLRHNH